MDAVFKALHHLNTAPSNGIAERWINRYDRPRVAAEVRSRETVDQVANRRPSAR